MTSPDDFDWSAQFCFFKSVYSPFKIIARIAMLSLLFSLFFCWQPSPDYDDAPFRESLQMTYESRGAQIETGNHRLGIEMHRGQPELNRISFYYPRANSIDLSRDYWKRRQWPIIRLALKINNDSLIWLRELDYKISQTPFDVHFESAHNQIGISVDYDFCKAYPALVASFQFVNRSAEVKHITFYSDWSVVLRTSHSYAEKFSSRSEYDSLSGGYRFFFDDPATGQAVVYFVNAGERLFAPDRTRIGHFYEKLRPLHPLNEFIETDPNGLPEKRNALFIYEKQLAPDSLLNVVQIAGSTDSSRVQADTDYLRANYQKEIKAREAEIERKTGGPVISTGDSILDHSVLWAQAILEVNQHELDGRLVPMPCPAQYNFYFSHDVLVSDLAAVLFDTARVRRDLAYIVQHSSADGRIPHARYWKDDRYHSEFAGGDNWNNHWFVIVAARYLRHAGDETFIRKNYPLLKACLKRALKMTGEDGLVWSARPDWWDIGDKPGPRTYLTVLTIQALRSFAYIGARLQTDEAEILHYSSLANQMETAMNKKLWDNEKQFFMNDFANGSRDAHYFIGSLLAPHFTDLTKAKTEALINTTEDKLLDRNLGIYNAFPMDFHERIDFYKFHGNEAGAPWYYFNGGIWPQGNAWFALALLSAAQNEKAFGFIKNVMSVKGVAGGPNGQPAMYEVRSAAPDAYGIIDKPQFMWAASWYLYSVYHLSVLRESAWNTRLIADAGQLSTARRFYHHGRALSWRGTGKEKRLLLPAVNERLIPALVLPEPIGEADEIRLKHLEKMDIPLLINCASILQNAGYETDTRKMQLTFTACAGFENRMELLSPLKPEHCSVDGRDVTNDLRVSEAQRLYTINLNFTHQRRDAQVVIDF